MRIGAGGDLEVVFQLSLVAVVDQIDARINALIAHSRKLRNVAMPFCRIVADEIVALAREVDRLRQPLRPGLLPPAPCDTDRAILACERRVRTAWSGVRNSP